MRTTIATGTAVANATRIGSSASSLSGRPTARSTGSSAWGPEGRPNSARVVAHQNYDLRSQINTMRRRMRFTIHFQLSLLGNYRHPTFLGEKRPVPTPVPVPMRQNPTSHNYRTADRANGPPNGPSNVEVRAGPGPSSGPRPRTVRSPPRRSVASPSTGRRRVPTRLPPSRSRPASERGFRGPPVASPVSR